MSALRKIRMTVGDRRPMLTRMAKKKIKAMFENSGHRYSIDDFCVKHFKCSYDELVQSLVEKAVKVNRKTNKQNLTKKKVVSGSKLKVSRPLH